jgi:hypothetical protein
MKLTPLWLCALVALAGCGNGPTEAGSKAESSSSAAGMENSPLNSNAGSAGDSTQDPLEASFAELTGSIAGDVGVAIAAEGGVRSFGSWTAGPAWSTIKVPLAIAALRHSAEGATPFVPLAIRDSDNSAAEKLWIQLGDPKEAAQAIGAVLREGGDSVTRVEAERKRPDFSVIGQTEWSVADQATFMGALPCLPNSDQVLADMKNLAANQQWGLALRPDSAVKGGWGPSLEKAYLVRQVATITTPVGHLGVALSALPQDGSFDSGVAQIGKLAEWVGEHLDAFAAKKCPS